MISGSWDKTIRIYDLYSKNRAIENLDHNSEITAVAFRPDGKEICVATLKGELYLWNTEDRRIQEGERTPACEA